MTDDEMQAYLETGTSALDQVFESHLAECRDCRERVESYRALFAALGRDPGWVLSPGFVGAVEARLAADRAAGAKRRWYHALWWLGGMAAAFGATAYFMGLGTFTGYLRGVFEPSLQHGTRAFNNARQAVGTLEGVPQSVAGDGGNTLIVVGICLLILAAVAGADHLIFRSRQAKFCL